MTRRVLVMNKDEILKALQQLGIGGTIITENGDTIVLRNDNEYSIKTALGTLKYSAEELAEELVSWDDEIFAIG
jgi:deoxyxylulose-5-phosphate synthase